MPRRQDIETVMLIGSGPIVIGQACEFDYSGTQACKVLRDDGFRVVLVNSNPATIMTDPEFADATYVEPITPEICAKIIAKEKPDALLPTLGGQTGLNTAVALAESGVLAEHGVEMIGAKLASIKMAEDRNLFKQAMQRIGLELPRSGFAYDMVQAEDIAHQIGFPLVIRPSFTLGGLGGGIAFNHEEFQAIAANGIMLSPISEILVEESVLGWKEYELEVMRDLGDNVVIICSIENFDAMGVHTGDSITVAPAQTLTDREYQVLRDMSLEIMREIGVETGGSNIQFAVNPVDGRVVIIEMNPRVSRSSALASKATGFPIAKFAAKLAVGYRLDEITNDITKKTPACFEPTIDYVVTKVPRWAFEKFPGTDQTLTTRMKSVGEAMAIGRTFKESLQKAMRSLETGQHGLGADGKSGDVGGLDDLALEQLIGVPNEHRVFAVKEALARGMAPETVSGLSKIDPWFVDQVAQLVEFERDRLADRTLEELLAEAREASGPAGPDEAVRPPVGSTLLDAKRLGYSDFQLGHLTGSDELAVRAARAEAGVKVTFKTVDTCAAEFEAETPYYYSTYETEDEAAVSDKPKVMILGSGPNRIGQGIEFDYCCVHASFALKELGYETIMVNCNPETVSTDYDTSDRLYFEPLTFEDVMNIVEAEKPTGVIVQFGGQTPLKLAVPLERAGVPILGTSPDSIDLAEDRGRFGGLLTRLGMLAPYHGTATSIDEAVEVAHRIKYPLLVRPSYVLGGRAMEIVYSDEMLTDYMARAVMASPEHPVLLDRFLEGAIEVDVDAISDGREVLIGAVMEHIEEAGVHSGDSACAIPPYSLDEATIATIKEMTRTLAMELSVCGLMNIQFAVKDGEVYVLEVNPRASRTVPFVSKAIGVPLAKVAAKVMTGKMLAELGVSEVQVQGRFAVKEAVMPFGRFPGVDTVLGPEMKSTGEVMGVDASFGVAYAKAQMATDFTLPLEGTIFVSVNDRDKGGIVPIARRLADIGIRLVSTSGTAAVLSEAGVPVEVVRKFHEGRPNVVDLIKNGEIGLIINTPLGGKTRSDGYEIRTAAASHGVPCITTMSAAEAVVRGIEALRVTDIGVRSLQEWQSDGVRGPTGRPRVPAAAGAVQERMPLNGG